MRGSNHLALSLVVPLAVGVTPQTAIAGISLVIGGLLPDIDGDGEIVRWGNWLPNVVPSPIRRGLTRIGLAQSWLIKHVFGHRGPCHWLEWGIAMLFVGYQFEISWILWLGVGFCLHWLGDAVTKQGAPIATFRLIGFRNISLTPMRVGGRVETTVGVVLWLAIFVLVGMRLFG